MKRSLYLTVFVLCAGGLLGAETLNGTISDSMCGATHPTGEHNGKVLTARECTQACIKKGAAYVVVSDGKVYTISNQTAPGLARYAGENVKVTGDVKGDSITVSKIQKGS